VPSIHDAYVWIFRAIENVSLIVFSVEYVLRIWVAVERPEARGVSPFRARLAYAVTPAAIIDLLAISPFFAEIFFPGISLRALILLRLLRLFKLGRYSTGFQSLYEAIRRERQALLASGLILFSVILVAATLAYIAERTAQPEHFGSIPQAVWWAIETVTTVGYGDVVPTTLAGRIVGGITMITGILMIALPVAIIGSSFAEVIRQRSFVVTFGMLARLPMFAGLGPDVVSDLLPHLRAMTADPGTPIIEPNDDDRESLFVVVEGTVEVDYPEGPMRLGPGGVFGSGPDLDVASTLYSAQAVTRVRLIAIERVDLVALMQHFPGLAARFRPTDEGRATA
jgi:voltage-gated potassium channel